jgi:hypothetical protein
VKIARRLLRRWGLLLCLIGFPSLASFAAETLVFDQPHLTTLARNSGDWLVFNNLGISASGTLQVKPGKTRRWA